MDLAASDRLARYMEDLERWASQAWLGCTEKKDLDDEEATLPGTDPITGSSPPR